MLCHKYFGSIMNVDINLYLLNMFVTIISLQGLKKCVAHSENTMCTQDTAV